MAGNCSGPRTKASVFTRVSAIFPGPSREFGRAEQGRFRAEQGPSKSDPAGPEVSGHAVHVLAHRVCRRIAAIFAVLTSNAATRPLPWRHSRPASIGRVGSG